MRPAAIAAVGITNQRETFVVWERRSGRPVHRAIVWQCRRSADICAALARRESEVRRRTGLLIDPYFSGTKLKWLLDSDRTLRRRAARGELCFGTIDTWLIFRLSRGAAFVTDFTNASRTMMLNLKERTWDPAMLRDARGAARDAARAGRLARPAGRGGRRNVRPARRSRSARLSATNNPRSSARARSAPARPRRRTAPAPFC